jgi:hypothetical protein
MARNINDWEIILAVEYLISRVHALTRNVLQKSFILHRKMTKYLVSCLSLFQNVFKLILWAFSVNYNDYLLVVIGRPPLES